MIVIWSSDWEGAAKFQYLMQILQVNFEDYIPMWQIFVEKPETVDKMVQQWQNPTTLWAGHPILGFMSETDFDDLKTVGLQHFNPMWSFPSISVNQNWEPITYHLKDGPGHEKDALVSQSPIVAFKASTVLQSLGIIASRIVLPSSDVKGGKKTRTYCPSTWNYAYTHDTPSQYSDLLRREGANSLLCQECILSVVVQLSKKNANHPQCAFADSESSVLSGLMVSLTPVYKPKIKRSIKLSYPVEFQSPQHLHQVLNRSSLRHQASNLFQSPEMNAKSCTSTRVPGTSGMSIALSRIARCLSTLLTRTTA